MLRCAKCNAEAVIGEHGLVVRTCEHDDATLIAEMSAHATGEAKVVSDDDAG